MVTALAAAAASCIDFVAPDLPALGAPAVFDASLRVRDGGSVQIEARLSPGLTEDGLRRRITRTSVRVLGRAVEPSAGGLDGRRIYFEEWRTTPDSVAGALTIEAPAIAGVGAPPALRWPGIRKLDRDTVFLAPEADLVLHVHTPADADPQPLNTSWLLQLEGFESSFVIGARGAAPQRSRSSAAGCPRRSAAPSAPCSATRAPCPCDPKAPTTSACCWSTAASRGRS